MTGRKTIKSSKLMPLLILIIISIILFTATPVIGNSLNIIVKDDLLNKPLGDALIELDEHKRKTNTEGLTVFENVKEGSHEIIISRQGYQNHRETIETGETEEINITIKRTENYQRTTSTVDSDNLPKIKINNLENNSVIENEDLQVEFSIESKSDIKSCNLLAKEGAQLGYSIKDRKKEPDTGKNTLTAKLSNGDFKIKIMCENLFGIAYSKSYSIIGEGFKEAPLVIGKTSSDNQETNSQGKKEQSEEDEGEVKKSQLTKEIEEIIKKLEKTTLEKDSQEIEQMIELLDYKSSIKKALDELKKLRQRSIDIEKLNIAQKDQNSQRNKIRSEFRKLTENTPTEIKIKENRQFISPLSLEDTQEALERYIRYKNNEEDVSKYNNLIEKTRKYQKNVSIYSKISHLEVKKANGNTKEYTLVSKEINSRSNENGFYIEIIPENLVNSMQDISFNVRYETISGESAIKFPQEKEELYYVFEGKIDTATLENAKTIFLLDPNNPSNKVTGFFISQAISNSGGTFILSLIILSILTAGLITFRTSNSIEIPRFRQPKKTNQKKQIEITKLLQEAITLIKNGYESEAAQLYPTIIKEYKKLGQKSKTQLYPMISYISNIAEVQYISSLINSSSERMLQGEYNQELIDEIDECYYNLHEEFIPKIKEEYDWYKNLVYLKNQRKDEQVNQIIYKKKNENRTEGINDAVFGK